MLSIPTFCLIAALVIGLVSLVRNWRDNLPGWGITLIAAALLWPIVR